MINKIKSKAHYTSEEGVRYQCELPLDVMQQQEMVNLAVLETMCTGLELYEIKDKLDKIIYQYSNISTEKDDLMVAGGVKQGLTVKHLAPLGLFYRKELLYPLFD